MMKNARRELTIDFFLDYLNNIRYGQMRDLAAQSVFNHHANGMHYLCLKRSSEETLKIYFLPQAVNPNSGLLVHPHNHRYNFDSIVLKGHLEHLRYHETMGPYNHEAFKYDWKTKSVKAYGKVGLVNFGAEDHKTGSSYYVGTSEIHTLKILEPTVIGLVQEADTNDDAFLYLPFYTEYKKADSYVPTQKQYCQMLFEVGDFIHGR